MIDLGGGALGSDGRNCIFGGAIYDLEATRNNVAAQNNWWGTAKGTLPGKVVETVPGYKIDASSPLRVLHTHRIGWLRRNYRFKPG